MLIPLVHGSNPSLRANPAASCALVECLAASLWGQEHCMCPNGFPERCCALAHYFSRCPAKDCSGTDAAEARQSHVLWVELLLEVGQCEIFTTLENDGYAHCWQLVGKWVYCEGDGQNEYPSGLVREITQEGGSVLLALDLSSGLCRLWRTAPLFALVGGFCGSFACFGGPISPV
jgi:hypothetical protein